MSEPRVIEISYTYEGKLAWPLERPYEQLGKGTVLYIEKRAYDELKARLEYCKESMCFHRGETRPGSNREWCFDCRSWVYPSDREMLAKIEGEK